MKKVTMKTGKKSPGWPMIKTINNVIDSHHKFRRQLVLCKVLSSYNVSDVGNQNDEQRPVTGYSYQNSLSSGSQDMRTGDTSLMITSKGLHST
jgi:hypothetical protein